MSKKKPTTTRLLLDMYGDGEALDASNLGESAQGAYPSRAPAYPEDSVFALIPLKTSSKGRKQQAAQAAAQAAADAQEAADEKKVRDLAYAKRYQPPPPPIKCEVCRAPKPPGASNWKPSLFGFSNAGICPACYRAPTSPKLAWKDDRDILSVRHAKLMQAVKHHSGAPPTKLKTGVVASAALHNPLPLRQRMPLLADSMRANLSASLLAPPQGVHPLKPADYATMRKIMTKHAGSRRKPRKQSKSKSKSRKNRR